jgi:hypothetical protein
MRRVRQAWREWRWRRWELQAAYYLAHNTYEPR